MPSDLVIVYHRQPYEEVVENGKTVFKENKSPNGIVPTLKSFFGKVDNAAWVAWKLAEDEANPGFEKVVHIEDSFGKYTVSRLPLTEAQVTSFYHVTSKEAFWPILHGFKEKYNYDPVDWPTFREVNWAFAQAAAAEAAEGAAVWVHDYNLWLVPGYLRQLRPDVRISFFHHTPFPAADMFNVLPWRGEIIDSLLACDVVGFHIPRYAANFVSVVRSQYDVGEVPRVAVDPDFISEGSALSDRTVPKEIRVDGRIVQLGTTPVGVDTDYIDSVSAREETATSAKEIKQELGDAKLILSVGRTDYTKGGAAQLLAFERLLERRPDMIGQVRLLHVSVSANRSMTVYESIQSEIEEIAGRINGRFGTFTSQPVVLISRAIPFERLVAYYRAADVCWITPLADGMNLVAKEFAASRTDGDGVLILSEFAGAAMELSAAILTNPYSNKSMDHAVDLALDLPEDERRQRMQELRRVVKKYNTQAWARDQLALLSPKDFGKDDPRAA
ncbi:glucosylglycerol-phosphate synthase [Puniceibacterium sp. IMCC21224]|uniref:glucosylglycerol-phosphate synthase n=1 Tax=Puniceibacterium sp. IMCC21224 TaxID=1618204 RepID=UPI00064D9B4E|nr:glucosylglycerol-phosphate synthase [Puniceibacterium sp. IMCC21224]KMK67474.1 glucosyl-glycerol phosphate synthase [Puniceibacterium sp. IMCC21224]